MARIVLLDGGEDVWDEHTEFSFGDVEFGVGDVEFWGCAT